MSNIDSLMKLSKLLSLRSYSEAELPSQMQYNSASNLSGMSGKSHLIRTIKSKYSCHCLRGCKVSSAKKGHQGSFHLTCSLQKKKSTKLIRLVYLFRPKSVFAFVTFIPILPAQGALEDELPRNTKF